MQDIPLDTKKRGPSSRLLQKPSDGFGIFSFRVQHCQTASQATAPDQASAKNRQSGETPLSLPS